jgi:hypothetical protein
MPKIANAIFGLTGQMKSPGNILTIAVKLVEGRRRFRGLFGNYSDFLVFDDGSDRIRYSHLSGVSGADHQHPGPGG